jgi:hypothetical protein
VKDGVRKSVVEKVGSQAKVEKMRLNSKFMVIKPINSEK